MYSVIRYYSCCCRHHAACEDDGIKLTLWEAQDVDGAHSIRNLEYIRNNPKKTRASKSQMWRKCGSVGSVIYSSVSFEDIDYSELFTVDDCLVVSAVDDTMVSLTATVEVKFVSSSMLESFIAGPVEEQAVGWCYDYLKALRSKCSSISSMPSGSISNAIPASSVSPFRSSFTPYDDGVDSDDEHDAHDYRGSAQIELQNL